MLTVLKAFAPGSFDLIETPTPLSSAQVHILSDKDLWKQLFSILKENADLSLHLGEALTS